MSHEIVMRNLVPHRPEPNRFSSYPQQEVHVWTVAWVPCPFSTYLWYLPRRKASDIAGIRGGVQGAELGSAREFAHLYVAVCNMYGVQSTRVEIPLLKSRRNKIATERYASRSTVAVCSSQRSVLCTLTSAILTRY